MCSVFTRIFRIFLPEPPSTLSFPYSFILLFTHSLIHPFYHSPIQPFIQGTIMNKSSMYNSIVYIWQKVSPKQAAPFVRRPPLCSPVAPFVRRPPFLWAGRPLVRRPPPVFEHAYRPAGQPLGLNIPAGKQTNFKVSILWRTEVHQHT